MYIRYIYQIKSIKLLLQINKTFYISILYASYVYVCVICLTIVGLRQLTINISSRKCDVAVDVLRISTQTSCLFIYTR